MLPMSITEILTDLFHAYPRLSFEIGDLTTYRSMRHIAPSLVSIVDGKEGEDIGEFNVLVLSAVGKAIGTVSYLAQENPHKSGKRNQYARIDLVITAVRYRTLGTGRAMLLCVILHLLQVWGRRLYSISCLAAHPAVIKTLQSINFEGEAKDNLNYIKMELKLEDRDIEAFTESLAQLADATLKKLNFNLQQLEVSL